ncbi:hypothetical protein BRPE64_ACDS28220 [Caballeronia insecticola]|uniref:Uncharacterized protein n=1 Tax=Caballeronia insecticola TaxID=758793 RepID=R4WYX6_9BURK|nr:hypothetical protein BRPE64_ACDS28220 [Caballeronia insecticola]
MLLTVPKRRRAVWAVREKRVIGWSFGASAYDAAGDQNMVSGGAMSA